MYTTLKREALLLEGLARVLPIAKRTKRSPRSLVASCAVFPGSVETTTRPAKSGDWQAVLTESYFTAAHPTPPYFTRAWKCLKVEGGLCEMQANSRSCRRLGTLGDRRDVPVHPAMPSFANGAAPPTNKVPLLSGPRHWSMVGGLQFHPPMHPIHQCSYILTSSSLIITTPGSF
jgi:hypothetical protein